MVHRETIALYLRTFKCTKIVMETIKNHSEGTTTIKILHITNVSVKANTISVPAFEKP